MEAAMSGGTHQGKQDAAKSMGDREEAGPLGDHLSNHVKHYLKWYLLCTFHFLNHLNPLFPQIPVGFLFIFIHKYLDDTVAFNVCVKQTRWQRGFPVAELVKCQVIELFLIHCLFLGAQESPGDWSGMVLSVSFSTPKHSAWPPTVSKMGYLAGLFHCHIYHSSWDPSTQHSPINSFLLPSSLEY